MADKLGRLSKMIVDLMKTPAGQAWAVQMYFNYPIGTTGHAEFDALIRKAKMNTKKATEYIEVELREILRGDVIQWRGTVFSVLSVDDAELENDGLVGGQVYLWVCQGDDMGVRGRRKSIQGLPDLAINRRKNDDQFAPMPPRDLRPDGEPLPSSQPVSDKDKLWRDISGPADPPALAGPGTDNLLGLDNLATAANDLSAEATDWPVKDDGPDDFDDAG